MGIDLNRSIINIDKPYGPTSFQIVDFVKKQLCINKASHFGTLDPKVTGVLPIALGRAARLTSYFSRQDKEYVGIMHFHKDIEKEKIEEAIKKNFLGKIKQLVPRRAKVKRQERERKIKKFEILEKKEKDVLFRIECEAGTYIRKICHDLGIVLGIGAHMTELRRTRAGIFEEKNSFNMYDFCSAVEKWKKGNFAELKKMLLPIECIEKIMPSLYIKKEAVFKLQHGSPIFRNMLAKYENFFSGEFVAVFFEKKLVEVAKAVVGSEEIKKIEKTEKNFVIAKPSTVLK